MQILVIGSGAVGSLYGSLLARQGETVSMVARSDYEKIRADGIHIRSIPLGDSHFRPAHIFRHASDMPEAPDVVMVCVKLVPGVDRIALLQGSIGPNTTIVLVSNGIGIEDEIESAFPDNEVISGLAFVGVTRTSPGEIWHQSFGRLLLGHARGGISPRAEYLASVFSKAGIESEAVSDITRSRWQKCVWNGAFNPLSVLAGGVDTQYLIDHHEALLKTVMREVCAIAEAAGYTLASDIDAMIEKTIAGTRKMKAYKTSMLVDHEAGHPMEVEAILGNMLRQARQLDISVPRLETLYELLSSIQHISSAGSTSGGST